MAIPTSRVKETAKIRIDRSLCSNCGMCADVCVDTAVIFQDGKVLINDNPSFGCYGCGHCMAVCPEGAIEIHGRTLSPDDLLKLPGLDEAAGYSALLALFQRRRSVRTFLDREVEPDIQQQILDAASTAPMGLPPSDVHVMVLDSRDKSRVFAVDFCKYLEKMKWFVSSWFRFLIRPFWGKAGDEVFMGFIRPLFRVYVNNMRKGKNLVTHDAPLVMYFYGSPYCDPADPVIAAATAMYAGESLGLGTCMVGGVHPMIQRGKSARRFRKKYGIKYPSRQGLFVVFGYHKTQWKHGIKRTFAG